MDKYLHVQGGRGKASFTFMIQQINIKKIDIFTLGTCSVLVLAILCLANKKFALQLCHYCFMWKPLMQNVVAYIPEKSIHLGFGFTLPGGKI